MRQAFAQGALLVWLCLASLGTAHADDAQAVLARKDFAAETSARMLVVLTAAFGQQAPQCLHDRYFGSPLLLRRTLWDVWRNSDANLEQALLAGITTACSKNPPDVTTSERQTWLRTGTESILLEPAKPALEQAANMVAAYERMRGNHASAHCAQDDAIRTEANRRASEAMRTEPRLPVTLAAYDAYRTLCGYNPEGPTASEIVLPAMPDVPIVARERLQIVQDFAICQSMDKANENACVEQAYQKRSKGLFNQLLSSDSRN